MSRIEEKFLQDYSLATLRDTVISSPEAGQLLGFNGSQFVNQTFSFGDNLEASAFEDETTSSTTSNGWVTKLSVTTPTKTAGQVVVFFTLEAGQSDKEKEVGTRIQFRFNGSGSWQTISDIRNGLSADDAFELRTGFNIITFGSDSQINLRAQFGQTDNGGTGRVRNVAFFIFRIGD